MADTMTPEQRHKCMAGIHSKDTKPEMIVRKWLWSNGFRYRLHVGKLPGHPDIVMKKHKTLIFINGCFWHGHNTETLPEGELTDSKCCKIPHTNRGFWLDKIRNNKRRDVSNTDKLRADGWNVITIWECELRAANRKETLDRLATLLKCNAHNLSGTYRLPEDTPLIAAEPRPSGK